MYIYIGLGESCPKKRSVGGHWFTWLSTSATRGTKQKAKKEEEDRYFLIPPRESSPPRCPLWADSSAGPGTADCHLSHSRARRKEKNQKVWGLTWNGWAQWLWWCRSLPCTYLGSQWRTKSALVCPRWFRCSIVMSRVSKKKNKDCFVDLCSCNTCTFLLLLCFRTVIFPFLFSYRNPQPNRTQAVMTDLRVSCTTFAGQKQLFGYLDTGDVGRVELLSSKSHRNQDDDGLPGLRERLLAQPLHIL